MLCWSKPWRLALGTEYDAFCRVVVGACAARMYFPVNATRMQEHQSNQHVQGPTSTIHFTSPTCKGTSMLKSIGPIMQGFPSRANWIWDPKYSLRFIRFIERLSSVLPSFSRYQKIVYKIYETGNSTKNPELRTLSNSSTYTAQGRHQFQ